MYHYDKVMKGIASYIDAEILTKINGWQRWLVGAGIGVSLDKAHNIFKTLKENPMVSALGIIDEHDNIDIELLYKEFKKQAQKGPVTFSIPLVGILTLNESDVDKLYMHIVD